MHTGCAHLCLLLLMIVSVSAQIHVTTNGTTNDPSCWTGGTTHPCGNLTLALEGMHIHSNPALFIHPGSYQLVYSPFTLFTVDNIMIAAYGKGEVTINCTEGAGLSFLNANNITLRGVSLFHCGTLQNRTRKDYLLGNTTEFVSMLASLYFLNCTDVTLDNITVSHSRGVAVQFYSTVGSNTIVNSTFTNNPFPPNTPQGGGVYIEFPYCYPGEVESCGQVTSDVVSNSHYTIQECHFTINHAMVYRDEATPYRQYYYAFGRGGGFSVVFDGQSANNLIDIRGGLFSENNALIGGGIYIDFTGETFDNRVTIQGPVQIANNKALEFGGGIAVRYSSEYSNPVRSNSLSCTGCNFTNNTAIWGGGLSVYATREWNTSYPTNTLSLTKCTFLLNVARYGAAIELKLSRTVIHGAVITPVFENCWLISNNAQQESATDSVEQYGALYMNNMPVTLKERNWFIDNYGSAIVSITASINFMENSEVHFKENRAIRGGAISLLANAFIVMNGNTTYWFVRNTASQLGGAIYVEIVGERTAVSRNCFLQYKNGISRNRDPHNWDIHVYFVENSMGKDRNGSQPVAAECRNDSVTRSIQYNAIFATSTLPCVFGVNTTNITDLPREERRRVFCWNDRWNYTCPCPTEIQTDPAVLVSPHHPLHVTPGVNAFMNVTAYDDLDQNVTSYLVFTAESDSEHVNVDTNYKYISSNRIQLEVTGPANSAQVTLDTSPPRILSKNLKVTLNKCFLGFELNFHEGVCKYSGYYHGYLRKSESNGVAEIFRGYWIGSFGNRTVVGQCFLCRKFFRERYEHYYNFTSGGYTRLNFTNDLICAVANRTGSFCTKCQPGYSMAPFSANRECRRSGHVLQALLQAIFIIVNAFYIVFLGLFVFITNISFTAGPLSAAIFFVQMVTTSVEVDADGIIPYWGHSEFYSAYTCVYGFFNLEFCQPLFSELTTNFSLPTVHLLSYLKGVLILFLVAIIWGQYGIRQYLSTLQHNYIYNLRQKHPSCFQYIPDFNKVSVNVRGKNMLASFLLLCYTNFSVVTLIVLTPNTVYNANGGIETLVPYLNSSNTYFQEPQNFIVPFLCLLFFVLPVPFFLLCCRYRKELDDSHWWCSLINNSLQPFQIHFREKEVAPKLVPRGRIPENSQLRLQNGNEAVQNGDPGHAQVTFAGEGKLVHIPCPKPERYHSEELDQEIPCKIVADFFFTTPKGLVSWSLGDYRFVAGAYLFLRLIFLIINAFAYEYMVGSMMQVVACVIAGILVLTCRPYKEDWNNNVDGIFFLALGLLISLNAYQYHLTQINTNLSLWGFIFQIILLAMPIVWILTYIIMRLIGMCPCFTRQVPSTREMYDALDEE